MNGPEEVTSHRGTTPASRKKSVRKKSGRKKVSRKSATKAKKTSKVVSTKKPVYACARHGYETDATASRESQLHGKAMHLGKSHGGRGTAKHGRRGNPKRPARHTTHNDAETTSRRISVHTRVGGRSHSVSPSKVESLKRSWLHEAADATPAVADAIVKCVNDLNGILGK